MKKIFSFLFLFFSSFTFIITTHASFTDVDPSNPYYEAIRSLEQRGVVEGYEDGTFKPSDFISRVEVLKIILKGSNISVDENQSQSSFSDVEAQSWYAPYVNKAKELGIVSGDADTGLFRPDSETNLAENLKMLFKAAQRKVVETDRSSYADIPIDSWFAPYFAYAENLSMFPQTKTENIYPGQPITRGMMADLMYQLSLKPEGYEEGQASYYGLNLHGNGTASGETFDAYALTAAHPTLPFGTMVKVKNLDNGKEVIVKINDRGPYTGGRIIDLSQAAFQTIAPLSQGVAHVSVILVEAEIKQQGNDTSCGDKENLKYLPKDSYKNVLLDEEIPNRFLSNEVLSLSGKLSTDEKEVAAFLVDSTQQKHIFYAEVDSTGKFKMNLFFPRAGNYQLGVIPGNTGTTTVQEIRVLSSNCQGSEVEENQKALSNLKIELNEGNSELKWNDSEDYELYKVTFSQGSKKKDYLIYDGNQFTPHYADFENWQEGDIEVQVRGAHLTSPSLLKTDMIRWSAAAELNFTATKHYQYVINPEEVNPFDLPETIIANQALTISVDPLVNINEKALIIPPSGPVESRLLTSQGHNPMVNNYGVRIFSEAASELKMNYTPTVNQVYFFELNNEQGQASLNIPLYPQGVYPLLPNPLDLETSNTFELSDNLNLPRTHMLNLINQDRLDQALPELRMDETLNDLAQMKANDMAKRSYLSHWTPEGLTVNQLRENFDINPLVSENIALDFSPELAEYGLMGSAAHRMNLLKTEWKQVGIGIAKNAEGGYIFVQIFSDNPVKTSNLDELREEVLKTINVKRTTPLTEKENLNTVSQQWSEKMVNEDFFSLISSDNTQLVDNIRDMGVKQALGTYLVGNSSFESALEQISDNAQLSETRWKDVGIGIWQDKAGIIKITLSFTE